MDRQKAQRLVATDVHGDLVDDHRANLRGQDLYEKVTAPGTEDYEESENSEKLLLCREHEC